MSAQRKLRGGSLLKRGRTYQEGDMPLLFNLRAAAPLRKEKSLESLEDGAQGPSPDALLRRGAIHGQPNSADVHGRGADSVLIVPALQVSSDQVQQSYNRAITSRGGLLTELQRATAASQVFYADSTKRPKNPWLFKRLYEWSSRAKNRETQRFTQEALKKNNGEYSDPQIAAFLAFEGSWRWEDVWRGGGDELLATEEVRRRQAVWELLHSEASFLSNQLLILRNVYLEPLKHCQVEGFLLHIEPGLLFANLEELCQSSYTFCMNFIASLNDESDTPDFGTTDLVLSLFNETSGASGRIAAFKAYCINYKMTMEYLERIRRTDDRFIEFEKICELDSRCKRLTLDELLIAPLHRITRLPILLREVARHTRRPMELAQLDDLVASIDDSLRSVNSSIQWLRNFERLQRLQRELEWPSVVGSGAWVPDFLRPALSSQICASLLANPKRTLVHQAALKLNEQGGKQTELMVFLFNDMLLLTKPKRHSLRSSTRKPSGGTERFVVLREPIPLEACVFIDVSPKDATSPILENAFVILHLTRFYQFTAAYTFQAASKEAKDVWIEKLQEGISLFEVIELTDLLRCTPLVATRSATPSPVHSPSQSRHSHFEPEDDVPL